MFGVDFAQLSIALGGVGAVVVSAFTLYRTASKDRTTQAVGGVQTLLGGWESIHTTTLKEVDRVRTEMQQQIADLRAEHAIEKAEWMRDSEAKDARIESLEAKILILIEERTRG